VEWLKWYSACLNTKWKLVEEDKLGEYLKHKNLILTICAVHKESRTSEVYK
jgi:hypothetical protein